ncbi:MAG: YeaH/YhbH family protein [Acidiferrobacterales bacterium]
MTAIFRPYSSSDALRSDRSAGDRLRHRQKVRQAIRENISDIISEESIIGQSGDRIIKVPIRGVKEYRFVYGDNVPGVGTGDGNSQPGQVIGQGQGKGQAGGPGGDQPGVDYYETDVTLDELVEIMFEDLQLPDMERKKLREVLAERTSKRKGYRRVGIHVHMDKRRTAIARVRRKMASRNAAVEAEEERFPFHREDVTFRRLRQDMKPQSNAVVFCIMDTSGSMDTVKKYLARSFFFLLYQFVRARYNNVEVVFVGHHTAAKEVTEDEFFNKGESGGTYISSGYLKVLEIVRARYHPTLWNIYAFHCSDGDNFPNDNDAALKAANELCEIANLFGYGEIKPLNSSHYEDSMLQLFKSINVSNFHTMLIERKEDIWPSFKAFLAREKTESESL